MLQARYREVGQLAPRRQARLPLLTILNTLVLLSLNLLDGDTDPLMPTITRKTVASSRSQQPYQIRTQALGLYGLARL